MDTSFWEERTMKPSDSSARKFDAKKLKLLHGIEWALAIGLLIFLLFRFVIGFSVVSGVSMRPTLTDGEPVLYTRIYGELNRGDIVSVRIPSGEYYVKRVVALGGDTVDLRDGILYVNGEPESGYSFAGQTLAEDGAFTYPYVIEEGSIFVLGDNREESIDSRSFGAVKADQVKGVLKLCIASGIHSVE